MKYKFQVGDSVTHYHYFKGKVGRVVEIDQGDALVPYKLQYGIQFVWACEHSLVSVASSQTTTSNAFPTWGNSGDSLPMPAPVCTCPAWMREVKRHEKECACAPKEE